MEAALGGLYAITGIYLFLVLDDWWFQKIPGWKRFAAPSFFSLILGFGALVAGWWPIAMAYCLYAMIWAVLLEKSIK